jgi:uncharacterized protein (TIGR00251 family)
MVEDLFDIRRPSSADADDGEVVLRVHVQPGAGRTAVVGRHGAALKLRVAAPPHGGRANEACASLLAETFGLSTSQVELQAGASSRSKQFLIRGVAVDAFRRRLEDVVQQGRGGPGPEPRQAVR